MIDVDLAMEGNDMKKYGIIFATAAGLITAATCNVASADTISHFTAKGSLSDKAKITGGVYVDTTTGVMTFANLAISGPDNITENNIAGQGENYFGTGAAYGVNLGSTINPSAPHLYFTYPTPNLLDYNGSSNGGNLSNGVFISTLKFSPDSIKKFYATGLLQDGAAITGYLTIDRTLGEVTRSALNIGGPDYVPLPTPYLQAQSGGNFNVIVEDLSTNDGLLMSFPVSTLVNYNGGSVASGTFDTPGGGQFISYLSFSTTAPPGGSHAIGLHSPVPEPAAWATMLLGLCGLGVALRRRRLLTT